MVSRIPEQRLVAQVCLLVAGDRGWHELPAMPAEWIDAEMIASKKVFRVAIPSRVVTLRACTDFDYTMRCAVRADANECSTARSCARVWWLGRHADELVGSVASKARSYCAIRDCVLSISTAVFNSRVCCVTSDCAVSLSTALCDSRLRCVIF